MYDSRRRRRCAHCGARLGTCEIDDAVDLLDEFYNVAADLPAVPADAGKFAHVIADMRRAVPLQPAGDLDAWALGRYARERSAHSARSPRDCDPHSTPS